MGLTHILRMPELSKLEIPEKQRLLFVKDETVFLDVLNEHRSVLPCDGPVRGGDYVLCELSDMNGVSRRLHVETGRHHFPELEAALIGASVGQTLHSVIDGGEKDISVLSVSRTKEYPLTDDSIAALAIDGVGSLNDYRMKYIREHGAEISEKVFRAIQRKLLEDVVALTEISVDEGELNDYHRQQRDMVQSISGDADKRLMDAYAPNGDKTPEECDKLFFDENKRTFIIYIWGKTLADERGVTISDEEYNQALEYYQMIHEKTAEQIAAENLTESVLAPFYIQYGIKEVMNHYKSTVRFSAEGISHIKI